MLGFTVSLVTAWLPELLTHCGYAVRYRSANMANSAIHPSGVVIHVIRYMDYGMKT